MSVDNGSITYCSSTYFEWRVGPTNTIQPFFERQQMRAEFLLCLISFLQKREQPICGFHFHQSASRSCREQRKCELPLIGMHISHMAQDKK